MHGKAQLAEKVRVIFERRLGIAVPGDDADLFAGGVLDSLSFINLLLQLESECGITIPLERLDLGQFSSVERIAGFVARETGAGPAFAPSMLSSTG